MDHDNKPKPTKGYKGVVILSVQGKSQRIVLEPARTVAPHRQEAAGALPADSKGVVQITRPTARLCRRDSTKSRFARLRLRFSSNLDHREPMGLLATFLTH